jgi:hypothetical protein
VPVVIEFGDRWPNTVVTTMDHILTGVVVYNIEGSAVSGRVTFSPELVVGRTCVQDVVIVPGTSQEGAFEPRRELRLNVHGLELDFRHWVHPTRRESEIGLELFEERDDAYETSLPKDTEEYAGAIIEQLIGMWLGRGDTDHLMYVANLACASARYHRELVSIGQLRSTIVDLDQQAFTSQERAGLLASQASEYQHMIQTMAETQAAK